MWALIQLASPLIITLGVLWAVALDIGPWNTTKVALACVLVGAVSVVVAAGVKALFL